MFTKNKLVLIAYVAVIFIVATWSTKSLFDKFLATNPSSLSPANQPGANLNNRKFVFMDLGVGPGRLLQDFFGDQYYFTEFMGRKILVEKYWDVYGFEANPYFNDTLDKLKDQLRGPRRKFQLFKSTAAWTYDGSVTFYLDTVNERNNFWGSSLKPAHPDVIASGNKSISVPSVDVARLLSAYAKDDFVVVAVDIEGGEYELLAHLIKMNVVRLIDYLVIDYHTFLENVKGEENSLNEALRLAGVKIVIIPK
jgi:FkbM family methyltransferase